MQTSLVKLQSTIPEHLNGLRLDQALAQLFPEHSRARLQTWIRAGQIQVEGKKLRSKDKVYVGQSVHIHAELTVQTEWSPQAIPLNIVYEDEALIIVNKPVGLVVHPAAGNPDQTLVNALLHHAPELAQLPRAGIVHRIDKNTSGLLVVARSLTAHTHLISQLQTHAIQREYLAVITGILITGGKVDAPIGRHPNQRTQMAVIESGKAAVTHYRIAERFHAHTLLQISLETGRTHQIRVHMAHIGHPLIGDPVYGGRLKLPKNCSEKLKNILQNFKHQALHAQRLTLIHPDTQQLMSWEADIPDDMQQLLEALRLNNTNITF